MVRNEANIPAEWIKPERWPENKTHGFISTQNGNALFHVLNDYSYNTMLRELAFRVDFLSARIAELKEAANVEVRGAEPRFSAERPS